MRQCYSLRLVYEPQKQLEDDVQQTWRRDPILSMFGTQRLRREERQGPNLFIVGGKTWCRRWDSNPRPRDYETLALPLSYTGKG
jgi:hypothetical protein